MVQIDRMLLTEGAHLAAGDAEHAARLGEGNTPERGVEFAPYTGAAASSSSSAPVRDEINVT